MPPKKKKKKKNIQASWKKTRCLINYQLIQPPIKDHGSEWHKYRYIFSLPKYLKEDFIY